jgi:hypothetical protein
MQPVPQHSCGSGLRGGVGAKSESFVLVMSMRKFKGYLYFTRRGFDQIRRIKKPRNGGAFVTLTEEKLVFDKRFFAFFANCR